LIGGDGSKISIFFCLSSAAAEKFSVFVLLSTAAGKIQFFSGSRRRRLKFFDGFLENFLSF
jgi:hypothetical protein